MSGSLLGVELKDLRSEPIGYMDIKDMYPMDFEEFIHKKLMELFRLYHQEGTFGVWIGSFLPGFGKEGFPKPI